MGWISSPWDRLNEYVLSLHADQSLAHTWKMICDNPLHESSIDMLVLDGWKINLIPQLEDNNVKHGACLLEEKEIEIVEGFGVYDRDKTLFHELIHAWYNYFGDPLNDINSWKVSNDVKDRCLKNGAIVEWLSRKKRATSSLLRHAVHSFQLKPEIYDVASYYAFVKDSPPDQMDSLRRKYDNGILIFLD